MNINNPDLAYQDYTKALELDSKEADCNDLQNAITLGFSPAIDAFRNLCK